MAINVLIEHIVSLDRGTEYAIKVNRPEVWSRLVKAQLDGLRIKDAIDSYIKAEDSSNYTEYLQMARKTLHEPNINMELAYAYAKTNHLHDMKDFLTMTNVADIFEVEEKCFEDELYQVVKLLFTSISNWARLVTTVIYLGENQAAVESAWKAGNTQVWKQVHAACIEKAKFCLAQNCGLNIIVHASSDRGHLQMGIFTELSALYGKYRPEKLMEHLKLFVSRINIPKACYVSFAILCP
ncbi:armadillo-type protein [Sparassis latifolia]